MSVLVVGLSHKSAPVAILEQAVVSGDTLAKLLRDVALTDPVAETFVVSTCNRVEVYADVDRFHAGVTAICELLARHCGVQARDLTAAPVRALRGPGGRPPARRGLRAGLGGGRRGPDHRPGALGAQARRGTGHRRPGAGRTRPARAAGGQAGPRRDRHRPGRAEPGQRGRRARRRAPRRRRGRRRAAARHPSAAARDPGAAARDPGAGRAGRARGRGRRDEHARGHHGRPQRRGEHRGGEPDPPPRGAPGREGGRRGGRARRPRLRPGRRGPGHFLHRRGRLRDHHGPGLRRAGRPEAPRSRWSSWTWPCRATWNRPWPACPASR